MRLQPVRPRGGPIETHLGLATTVILIVVAAAIVKPWSGGPDLFGIPPTPGPTAATSPPATTPPRCVGCGPGFSDLVYDPSIFGTHEPAAAWDLRPAAFLVTYGFVFNLPAETNQPPGGPRSSGASPRPSRTPAPTDGGPAWPSAVAVPAGYHMFVIGIDMPMGYQLTAESLLRNPGAEAAVVALVSLTSPWPDHFAVIGIPAGATDHLEVWQPGSYRLTLRFEPGGIERTIEIDVAS
jgi:hypothetical protein